MSGQHTPTPWSLFEGKKSRGLIFSTCKGFPQKFVAQTTGQETTEEREANAAFIVEAVNSYATHLATIEALVGALEKCTCVVRLMPEAGNTVFGIPGHGEMTAGLVLQQALSALSLARGEKR